MQNTFKVECWQKRHVVIFQWMFRTFKVFCMLKSAQNIRCGHFLVLGGCALDFKVFLHVRMAKFGQMQALLKVKYLVNAVYFIRKLQGNGLIFKILLSAVQFLKRELLNNI